jgi:glutathionylspermidine synthase
LGVLARRFKPRVAIGRGWLGPRRIWWLGPWSQFLMRRHRTQQRDDWQKIVESQGMYYHTAGDVPYWDESAYYEFTSRDVDALEQASYELDRLCLAAVEHVLDRDLLDKFLIPREFHSLLRDSWEHDERTVYGRFDLGYDGTGSPKLLEYNADTPTALLESAVVQWYWLKDSFPRMSQFNSIHERLLEVWRLLAAERSGTMYFSSLVDCIEDYMTVTYLRDVAIQAGWATTHIAVEDIGWHEERGVFTDKCENPIRNCFKLYPWEWMFRDEFGRRLPSCGCQWLEPPWKAILSNKAILPVLWELYPSSPYLLEASFTPLPSGNYVAKPIFGREGANVQVFERGQLVLATDGPYEGPAVYQERWPLSPFEGKYFATIGSWMVNGWACGIGIREDQSIVAGNLSRFVPHVI